MPHPEIRQPDRSTWIVIFGILEIAIGLACLLLCAFLLAAAALGDLLGGQGPRLDAGTVASSLAVYLVFAAFFIWVGVGTIRKRRWARPLMLSSSWIWLAVGVLGMGMWFFALLPRLGSLLQMPSEADPLLAVVQVVATLVMGFIYIVLPLLFLVFFRSESVRRTFEVHDPVTRWTDRCSHGVLSMILTLAYGALTCLFALSWNVVPFFGVLLDGVPAAVVLVASGAVLAWLAYGFYQLRASAWWGTLVLTVLWTVSSVLTFLRVSVEEIYRAAGLDMEQAAMFRDMGMAGQSFLVGVTLLTAVTMLGYLVYLRKDFRAPHF